MSNNLKFGIVQGRLIQSPEGCLQWFPQESWESEFFLAPALGYDFIELIGERDHNSDNPIWSDFGIKKIRELCVQNNLSLHAFCDDYIIDHPLLEDKAVVDEVLDFIGRGKLLGVQKIVLPLFEKSELTDINYPDYKEPLIKIANAAQNANILVCIETVLDGKSLQKVLNDYNHPNIKCVFDTGNRIAFGHDIYSDIVLLDQQIQHVHIKDKNAANENVRLGTGNVNFYEVFKSLFRIGYKGPFTYETFRGHNPVRTARYNRVFTDYFVEEALEDENK